MNEQNYKRIREWFLEKNYRYQILKIAYKLLPFIVFLTYGTMIISLLIQKDNRIIKFILIPLVLFVLVSIFRKVINSPRPYVVLNIEPLIKRDKTGESFPSRHMLSVSVIAAACFYINIYFGIVMCVIAVFIGIIRVVSGVHFIKDVLCGAILGFIGGGIFFIL